MFKNSIVLLLFVVLFSSFSANAFSLFKENDDDVLEVRIQPDFECTDNYPSECNTLYRYFITPAEDGLIVYDVEINDGKCKAQRRYFNKKLTVDDYAEAIVISDEAGMRCRPRTMDISTNRGDWTYDF